MKLRLSVLYSITLFILNKYSKLGVNPVIVAEKMDVKNDKPINLHACLQMSQK
jgi:hypothetical protein